MDEGVSAELRSLRARAYAPGGDIADDPAAIARLAELETAERARRAAASLEPAPDMTPADLPPGIIDSVPGASPGPQDDAASAGPAAAASDDASEDASADASVPPRRRPALRSVLMWAGSLVAVAALAAGATFFATARSASTATALPQDARITHVTTLLPTGTELPPMFENWVSAENAADALAFEQFFGLALFDVGDAWSSARGFGVDSLRVRERCLVMTDVAMLEPRSDGSGAASLNQGCSAGSFPAAITMIVREQQPEELRDRYPIGTALQFVLTDAGVDVFVSPAPEPAETPAARAAQPAG